MAGTEPGLDLRPELAPELSTARHAAVVAIAEIVVVVPAANEQKRIGACLDALVRAQGHLRCDRPQVVTRIVVVLDDCHDDTAAIVGRYCGVESIATTARCVGAARRTGTDHALAGTTCPAPQLWIASTDADSRVPADWLTGVARASEAGYTVVLGTVVPDTGLGQRVEDRWFALHPAREGHPHIHGANMSFRADAYHAAGGWPALHSGEDVELARRLSACHWSAVLRTAHQAVTTSARSHGRAPRGFSGYLRDLALEG